MDTKRRFSKEEAQVAINELWDVYRVLKTHSLRMKVVDAIIAIKYGFKIPLN